MQWTSRVIAARVSASSVPWRASEESISDHIHVLGVLLHLGVQILLLDEVFAVVDLVQEMLIVDP